MDILKQIQVREEVGARIAKIVKLDRHRICNKEAVVYKTRSGDKTPYDLYCMLRNIIMETETELK